MGENDVITCQSLMENQNSDEMTYEEKLLNCNEISKPMSSKKQASRILKLIKKASSVDRKNLIRIGVKPVLTKIRKGETGIVVIAGDIMPIDVICHVPGVCEEKGLPYIFVPSKFDISSAVGLKGSAQVALVLKNGEYEELYDKVLEGIKKCHASEDE